MISHISELSEFPNIRDMGATTVRPTLRRTSHAQNSRKERMGSDGEEVFFGGIPPIVYERLR